MKYQYKIWENGNGWFSYSVRSLDDQGFHYIGSGVEQEREDALARAKKMIKGVKEAKYGQYNEEVAEWVDAE